MQKQAILIPLRRWMLKCLCCIIFCVPSHTEWTSGLWWLLVMDMIYDHSCNTDNLNGLLLHLCLEIMYLFVKVSWVSKCLHGVSLIKWHQWDQRIMELIVTLCLVLLHEITPMSHQQSSASGDISPVRCPQFCREYHYWHLVTLPEQYSICLTSWFQMLNLDICIVIIFHSDKIIFSEPCLFINH